MKINYEQCMGCGNCISSCPKKLLKIGNIKNASDYYYLVNIKPDECINCGSCELMCTADAITTKNDPSPLHDLSVKPLHPGCNFGTLRKVYTDVISKLSIEKDIVIFTQEDSHLGLNVDFREYGHHDEQYYEDALKYKKDNPDKLVIIQVPCVYESDIEKNRNRFISLKNDNITIVHSFLYFKADENFDKLISGGNTILDEVNELGYADLIYRGNLRSPKNVREFEKYIQKAILNQKNNKSFSIIELDLPCYYLLTNRNKEIMRADKIAQINKWFENKAIKNYEPMLIKD